jgi:hypothetical protein
MFVLIGVSSLLMCQACASASGTPSGPNGKPTYTLVAVTGSALFKKATEKCPAGYTFITPPFSDISGLQEATVECK